jgi:hypothetical protein
VMNLRLQRNALDDVFDGAGLLADGVGEDHVQVGTNDF